MLSALTGEGVLRHVSGILRISARATAHHPSSRNSSRWVDERVVALARANFWQRTAPLTNDIGAQDYVSAENCYSGKNQESEWLE